MSQLRELLVEELRDLLHGETQLTGALPKMAAAAHHPKLQEAFGKHLQPTEVYVERLKKVFELLGEKPSRSPDRKRSTRKGLLELALTKGRSGLTNTTSSAERSCGDQSKVCQGFDERSC
jgi:ferritin-like metal-binding protein YciE